MSPSTTESIVGALHEAHAALGQALDGMDYCLDWRPSPGEWSARETVSHLLGRGRFLNEAMRRALHGDSSAMDLREGKPQLAPARSEQTMLELRAELDGAVEETARLLSHVAERHPQLGDAPEQNTLPDLVEEEYRDHWPEHIRQLSQIRYSLGL